MSVAELQELEEVKTLLAKGQSLGVLTFAEDFRYATPFGLTSPEQFRVPPPPSLRSRTYARAYDEVKSVGVLDAVERSSACRNVGNAVWWGGGEGRIEDFRAPEAGSGLQIWRPDFDRLLAAELTLGGADQGNYTVSTTATDLAVQLDGVTKTIGVGDAVWQRFGHNAHSFGARQGARPAHFPGHSQYLFSTVRTGD